jgi:imidazolonepropionase-like amidohydrolase
MPPSDAATVITNVRVFDGTATTAPRTVVIEDGLIVIDPSTGRDFETVDAGGGVLLPGLIDAHVHIDRLADLEQCARAGVTTVVDLATRDLASLDALRERPGLPTLLRAGLPASAPGGAHTKKMGFTGSSAVVDEADAGRFVADRVKDGVDVIKVIVEDPRMPGTAALAGPTIAAIVTAAHEAGLLVVAHAVTSAALGLAADAGVDVLTHAPVNRHLTADEATALKARGTVLVPTLTMMRGTTAAIGGKLVFRLLRRLKVAPPLEFAHAMGSVKAAHAAGVVILAGTDANNEGGAPFQPAHGSALHDELANLVEAGLTPTDAIRAATVVPATVFDLRDRGVIAPGWRADLVLVGGDPCVDIAAVRDVRTVWIGGRRVPAS